MPISASQFAIYEIFINVVLIACPKLVMEVHRSWKLWRKGWVENVLDHFFNLVGLLLIICISKNNITVKYFTEDFIPIC